MGYDGLIRKIISENCILVPNVFFRSYGHTGETTDANISKLILIGYKYAITSMEVNC